ncbi:hypothetical protein ACIBBD_11460 [Streptomyces sp. NPDC051315]|uniref:hypothetical protein n=1 Tax=Streptomyces sp. NPDC051315 TaxID=3365650 RepID=UPI00378AF8C1
MNPIKRLGRRRVAVLPLMTVAALMTPGTATGATDTVRASAPGAQAAQSGRYFGTAVAAGRPDATHHTAGTEDPTVDQYHRS